MPSYILFDEGHVFMTSSMTNIRDFPMRDYLSERLPVLVVFDNDANVAALAEHRHGAGRIISIWSMLLLAPELGVELLLIMRYSGGVTVSLENVAI